MDEPKWMETDFVMQLHDVIVQEIGGSSGIRDQNGLESALGNPQNQFYYGENPDIFDIAASYAHGIAKNHAFIDGNKRTAFVVSGMFLERNGYYLDAEKALSLEESVVNLASGKITKEEYADALRGVARPLVITSTSELSDLADLRGEVDPGPFCRCCEQFSDALYTTVCELIEARDAASEDISHEREDDGMELTS